MKEKNKSLLLKYLIPTVIGLITAFGIMYALGIFQKTDPAEIAGLISDGFFVVGMLFTGFGLLLWISSTGVLDIVTYGFKSVLMLFTPINKRPNKGGFYEYKLEQKEKRRPVPFQILWVGICFIFASFAFVVIYYNVG